MSVVIGILFFSAWSVHAQKLTAAVDTGSMLIGDKRHILIQVQVPANWQYDTLEWLSADTNRVIEQAGTLQLKPDPQETGQLIGSIPFMVFDSGTYNLPPVILFWKTPAGIQKLMAAPGIVFVDYPTTNAVLAPLKDVIEEPSDWTDNLPYLWVLPAILGLAAALYYYLQNRTFRKTQAPRPLNPLELALNQLLPFTGNPIQTAEQAQKLHVAISNALRCYLELNYNFNALEATTEIIKEHMTQRPIEIEHQQQLFDLLDLTDLVKFAQLDLSEQDHAETLNRAIKWLKYDHETITHQDLSQQP